MRFFAAFFLYIFVFVQVAQAGWWLVTEQVVSQAGGGGCADTGITTIGASDGGITVGYALFVPVTSAANCDVNTINIYTRGVNGATNIKVALYSDNGTPDGFIEDNSLDIGVINTTAGWLAMSLDAAQTLSSSTTYWIGIKGDDVFRAYYDAGATVNRTGPEVYANAWTDPAADNGNLSSRDYSAYLSYVP